MQLIVDIKETNPGHVDVKVTTTHQQEANEMERRFYTALETAIADKAAEMWHELDGLDPAKAH